MKLNIISSLVVVFLSQSAFSDKCLQPLDFGTCQNIMVMYYYNVDKDLCEPFDFNGCGGNDNNFATLADCELACVMYDQSPLHSHHPNDANHQDIHSPIDTLHPNDTYSPMEAHYPSDALYDTLSIALDGGRGGRGGRGRGNLKSGGGGLVDTLSRVLDGGVGGRGRGGRGGRGRDNFRLRRILDGGRGRGGRGNFRSGDGALVDTLLRLLDGGSGRGGRGRGNLRGRDGALVDTLLRLLDGGRGRGNLRSLERLLPRGFNRFPIARRNRIIRRLINRILRILRPRRPILGSIFRTDSNAQPTPTKPINIVYRSD